MGGTTTTTQAAARTNSAFGQFTLTIDPTYTLNLRNQAVTFELAKGGTAGTRQIFVDVSLDGFTTVTPNGTTTFAVGGPTVAASNTAYQSVSYLLPDLEAFQSISSSVAFRFYSFHNGTNLSVRVDDIIVNGSVSSIPEPSSFGFIAGMLVLPAAMLRRRRRA